MDNKLVVRLPKNIFYRSEKYLVRIKGYGEKVVSYTQNRVEFDLPMGIYMVEIENDYNITVRKVVLTIGQRKVVKVAPAAVEVYWIPVVAAMVGAIIAIKLSSNVNPYMLWVVVLLFPLIFIKRKHCSKRFNVTV